jgi:hypothetical protein
MLGAGVYPITLAEMPSYSEDADRAFKGEEHERLKEFLALHPESGDVIAGTGGVRLLRWPIKSPRHGPRVRIVYYFRDLNMPLQLLALYGQGERIPLSPQSRREIETLVEVLVDEYSKRWAQVIALQSGA